MAETSIGVQAPPAPGAPIPAPIAMRLVQVQDSNAVAGNGPAQPVVLQTFVLQDDQGRAITLMTDETGRKICRLLAMQLRVAIEGGGMLSDEVINILNENG
jgi:hypothetical protein